MARPPPFSTPTPHTTSMLDAVAVLSFTPTSNMHIMHAHYVTTRSQRRTLAENALNDCEKLLSPWIMCDDHVAQGGGHEQVGRKDGKGKVGRRPRHRRTKDPVTHPNTRHHGEEPFVFVVTDRKGQRVYGCAKPLHTKQLVHDDAAMVWDESSVISTDGEREEDEEEWCRAMKRSRNPVAATKEVFVLCALSSIPCSKLLADVLTTTIASMKGAICYDDLEEFKLMVTSRVSFASSVSISPISSPKKKNRKFPSPCMAPSSPLPNLQAVEWEPAQPGTVECLVRETVQIAQTLGGSCIGDGSLPQLNFNSVVTDIPLLICSLTPRCLTNILAALMEEKRVVLSSSNTSKLSRCVLALSLLVSPLLWPHSLIPLLSRKLLDVLAAPVPYLVGVPAHLEHAVNYAELDQVLWVDVDSGDTLAYAGSSTYLCMKTSDDRCVENISQRIPRRPRSRLERKLAKLAHTQWTDWTGGMVKSVENAVETFYNQVLAKCPSKRKENGEVQALAVRMFNKPWEEPFRGFVEVFCESIMYRTWKEECDAKNRSSKSKQVKRGEKAGQNEKVLAGGEIGKDKPESPTGADTSWKRKRAFPLMKRRKKVQYIIGKVEEIKAANIDTPPSSSSGGLKNFFVQMGEDIESGGVNTSYGALRWRIKTKRDVSNIHYSRKSNERSNDNLLKGLGMESHPSKSREFVSQPLLSLSRERGYQGVKPRLHSDLTCASEAARRIDRDPLFRNAYPVHSLATLV